ncbi:hypothetical protein HQQ82_12210 [Rathayibacter sp. VKM Ac-2856]|jgi:hypothetical protein|uniref:hypothetical protein n=1 Tax=unclassified Rathayibacter TaxID=2609250 RepID=UPI0015638FE6|nr:MULTISPECIES: hypothetical protein [unclassified Rathayibacter]NQX05386.1 hypothetical protein [Rathayibacter sp. VKM Ac-2858]NQX20739.1 hypothetical protein [Rathayibacter sp. VKM Ac-2856]
MQHRRTTATVLAAGLLLTSVMQSSLFTDQNAAFTEALNDPTETAAAPGDRDVLLINGNAFDLS